MKTANQIVDQILELESLETWRERMRACVYLDRAERERQPQSTQQSIATPHHIAAAILARHNIQPGWKRTGEQVLELIAEAVALDRSGFAARETEPTEITIYYVTANGVVNSQHDYDWDAYQAAEALAEMRPDADIEIQVERITQ